MMKFRYLIFVCFLFLLACDVPEGYEKELIETNEWPKTVSGSFSFLDSDTGDGKFATWAIGILEVPEKNDNILIEFRGNTLEKAGIDLEFNIPDPVTVSIGPPKERYFQVRGILNQ
jgi:hypothetical protein